MLTPSIGLHVFLAINKFLNIDHLFKYIYIYVYIERDRITQLSYE